VIGKTQNCDANRLHQVICAKTNGLFDWIKTLDQPKKDSLLLTARKKRSRRTEEIRELKKDRKRRKLDNARAKTPFN
jgi:hypothetical protein